MEPQMFCGTVLYDVLRSQNKVPVQAGTQSKANTKGRGRGPKCKTLNRRPKYSPFGFRILKEPVSGFACEFLGNSVYPC